MLRRCSLGRSQGFTLMELIIVVAVIGILAVMALPNLKDVPRRAREATLKNNVHTMRSVIDQFKADRGVYPPALDELVEKGYLRRIPFDSITKSQETWILEYEEQDTEDPPAEADESAPRGIFNVRSGAPGVDIRGVPYAEY